MNTLFLQSRWQCTCGWRATLPVITALFHNGLRNTEPQTKFQGLGQLPLISTVTDGIVMLHEGNCFVHNGMLHLRMYMPCQARWLYARVVIIPIVFCIQIHRYHLGEKGTVPSPKRNRPGHAYSYIIYLQTRLAEHNWPMFAPLIIIVRNLADFPISGTFPISRIHGVFSDIGE